MVAATWLSVEGWKAVLSGLSALALIENPGGAAARGAARAATDVTVLEAK